MSELRQRRPADHVPSQSHPSDGPSNIRPAVATPIIAKLLLCTLLLVTVPLGTFFLSLRTIFRGNNTYAGALAAIMANVVLVGYLLVAVWDDQKDQNEVKRQGEKEKDKKFE